MLRWVFGYGSLVWRPAFEHRERAPASISGWVRRFHQGSTDHRGTPEAPGRVVTLEPDAAAECWGVAYAVDVEQWQRVRQALDVRESGGYQRHEVTMTFADAARAPVRGLVYVASADNPNYLGPAPMDEIAAQVCRSHGPSGPNPEYVLRLEEALAALRVGMGAGAGAVDEHVSELATRVRALSRAAEE